MPIRRCSHSFVRFLAPGALALAFSTPAQAVEIEVNASETHQTMKGWEVIVSGLEVGQDDHYNPDWVTMAPEAMDYLVNEIGVNRVRLEFGSGTENPVDYWAQFTSGAITYDQMKVHFYEKINDNSDANVVSASGFQLSRVDFGVESQVLLMKQALEANGESLYVTLCDVDFSSGQQGTLSHATNAAEYAEIVSVIFNHLDDTYGFVPDALEITLEPENTNGWGGTQIGNAIVAAATRLHNEGYDPEIIAPSVTNASNAVPYFNAILAVSGAEAEMSMLAYHRYVGGDYAGIFQAADAHGIETGMLEYVPGNVDHLLEDLTVANVSAWEKYAVVSANAGNDYAYLLADLSNSSNPSFSASASTKALVPYFRYVRNGAVRVGVTSDSGGFKPVAFVNENGSYVVVVKADSAGTLNLTGLADATYGVYTAASSGQASDGSDVVATSGALTVTVEAGVTAIYDKEASPIGAGGAGGAGSGGTDAAGGSATVGGSSSTGGAGTGGTSSGPASGGATAAGGTVAGTTGGAGGNASGGTSVIAGGTTGNAATGGSNGSSSGSEAGCGCSVAGADVASAHGLLALLSAAVGGALFRRKPRRSVVH